MDDFFRQNLASLKGSETKILVALLACGQLGTTELVRVSGVSDRKTLFSALSHLQELGAVGKPNRLGWETTLPQLGNPTVYIYPGRQTLPESGRETLPVVVNPTSVVGKPNQSGVETLPNQLENPTDTMEEAIAAADEMDASGDERQPNSPFQIRRKHQIALIQEAWVETFSQEIKPQAAKELLQVAHSQAVDLYEAMQSAAGHSPQYPLSYVRKILEKGIRKPVQTQTPKDRDTEEVGVGLNRPQTPEQRQAMLDADRLARETYLKDWLL